MAMPNVMLDADLFVRGLINPRSIWGRIIFDHATNYDLFLSDDLVDEILAVVHRPEVARKFRALDGLDLAAALAVLDKAERVEPAELYRTASDPTKDDAYLATAHAAQADYLVTEDQDLLVLGTFGATSIVNAATFLGMLERADDS